MDQPGPRAFKRKMGGWMDEAEEQGIYGKYTVTNNATGEIVTDFFLLRPCSDDAAKVAVACYAAVTTNKRLAHDLRHWLAPMLTPPGGHDGL